MGANSAHGLRRTNADKHKAVMTLLHDDEWSGWTNREIARHCAVSHSMVNDLRASLEDSSSEKPAKRTYTNKYGTKSTMNTENIGKGSNNQSASDRTRQFQHMAGEGCRGQKTPPAHTHDERRFFFMCRRLWSNHA